MSPSLLSPQWESYLLDKLVLVTSPLSLEHPGLCACTALLADHAALGKATTTLSEPRRGINLLRLLLFSFLVP